MNEQTMDNKVQRLVQRVRQKHDRRTAVKVRTVLSAFGYSRRSADVVRTITQQLAAEGIAVDFSVDTPPTLDDRIELRAQSVGAKQTDAPKRHSESRGVAPTAAAVAEPPHDASVPKPPVPSTPADPGPEPAAALKSDLPSPPSSVVEADTRRVVSDFNNEQESLPAVNTSEGTEANRELPRSFASRLFRAALSLFNSAPPTTLGLIEAAHPSSAPTPSVSRSSAIPPPKASETMASSSVAPPLPVPPSDVTKTVPATHLGGTPGATTSTPELSSVAEQTIQATVFVQVERGHGSGFIVHPDGLVVTACHVLDGPSGIAKKATIRTHDGRDTTASLVRAHRSLDFALLWVDKSDQYPSLRVGDASKTRYAETVLAVGHPGLGGGRALRNTVSTGVVANPACTERGIEWIQMTTDIDPGNSGGPLMNRAGEVIGVNCWKFTAVAAAKMALPIDYLREDLAQAMERGHRGRESGHVCSICGEFDSQPADWFCRTCGAAHAVQSAEPTKGN